MSKSEELAAKAARMKEVQRERDAAQGAARGAGERSEPTTGRPVAGTAVRVRPVRLTVDVSPADHAALQRWCLEAAAEVGVARVHGQELVRALLSRTLADPAARAAVIDEVAAARAR